MKDMSQYDATEVHPIIETIVWDEETGKCVTMQENCTGDEEKANAWSVMLHLKDGGIDCLCDCANEEDAIYIAHAIDAREGWANGSGR